MDCLQIAETERSQQNTSANNAIAGRGRGEQGSVAPNLEVNHNNQYDPANYFPHHNHHISLQLV